MTAAYDRKRAHALEHGPALLSAMLYASVDGLAPGEWLQLAERKKFAELREAIQRFCPDPTPNKFGPALKALVGVRLAIGDEPAELRSKFVNRRHQTLYGVACATRDRVVAQRQERKAKKASLEADAREIAKQLRTGKPLQLPPAAPVAPRWDAAAEAAEIARRAGYDLPPDPPRAPAASELPPAVGPVAASVEDTTAWPPAWRKHGKPSYATPVHEAPDDSFNGALFKRGGSRVKFDPNHPELIPRSPLPK